MEISEITKLLHHRPPYLMVSSVSECSAKKIVAHKSFTGEEFFLQGHFPGAPVVPGAMLQEFCTQSAGILISKHYSPVDNYDSDITKGHALGVLRKVNYAKFIDITKPNSEISCHIQLEQRLDQVFTFTAKVLQGEKVKAKLGFTLVNISDEHLF